MAIKGVRGVLGSQGYSRALLEECRGDCAIEPFYFTRGSFIRYKVDEIHPDASSEDA